MQVFALLSLIVTLAAIFSYVNVRIVKLPAGISLLLMGSTVALLAIFIGHLSSDFEEFVRTTVEILNFPEFILGMMLSFLLFAGSLHVNAAELRSSGLVVATFAVFGTLLSTAVIGLLSNWVFALLGFKVPLIACLLLGAIVSPTDPIAVLGIIRKVGLPKAIETYITGESLFNDGIGVVLFATLLEISLGGIENFDIGTALVSFARESIGGILVGFAIGYAGYRAMKSIDHFQTEILISIAMVMGGYTLCHMIHVSGPLAMVVAGILTGSHGRANAMSDTTRDYLEKYWEVTDEILNAILFMLIGLELVSVKFQPMYLIAGLVTATLLVVTRYISLWLPATAFRFRKRLLPKTLAIMTWGGLRGGISIALVLSLPQSTYKELFVSVAFIVVLSTVVIQGLSIGVLIRKWKLVTGTGN